MKNYSNKIKKSNSSIPEILRRIFYVAGAIGLVTLILHDVYSRYHLSNFPRYTEGEIIGFSSGGRGNSMVDYQFEVNGKQYTGSSFYDAKVDPEIGDKFTIRYSYKDPNVSRLEY